VKEKQRWPFDQPPQPLHKSRSNVPIDNAMIEGRGDVHHRPNDDCPV